MKCNHQGEHLCIKEIVEFDSSVSQQEVLTWLKVESTHPTRIGKVSIGEFDIWRKVNPVVKKLKETRGS